MPDFSDFTIGGTRYQGGKLPPKVQMHVLKRLARLAPSLKDAGALAARLKDGQRPGIDDLADTLAPVVASLGDMPDDDLDYVMDRCLEVATWADPTGQWYPVSDGGHIMHSDNADLLRSLGIVWNVLQHNFSGMFASLATTAAPVTSSDQS